MNKYRHRKRGNRPKTIKICVISALVLLILWLILTANIKIDTETETLEVGEQYQEENFTATLLGINVNSLIKVHDEVNTEVVGTYEIVYRPIFSIKKYTKIVIVQDSQVPKIELLGDEVMWFEGFENYREPGFIAEDNYDGNITSKVNAYYRELGDGSYEVEYSVTDSSGNTSSVKRILKPYVGIVCLTFDDGPSTNNTPAILDILAENSVKATFFVLDYTEEEEYIIRRMVREGHTVGLHGMSHEYSEIYQSVDTVMQNFYELEEKIYNTTNGRVESVRYIRFPGGSSNTVSKHYCIGVMTDATFRATEEGYIYFDWNVDSYDTGGADTAEEIYQNVINGISPGQTNIVLMHDAPAKEETVLALERIIDYCIENGYCLMAINENTRLVQHNVAN